MGWKTKNSGFDHRKEQESTVFSSSARRISYNGQAGALFPGLKRPRREADRFNLSSAKMRNVPSYVCYVLVAWCSVKQRQL
jgi:hypothetical protein